MIDKEIIQTILGIKGEVSIIPEEMVKKMKITFLLFDEDKISPNILKFYFLPNIV